MAMAKLSVSSYPAGLFMLPPAPEASEGVAMPAIPRLPSFGASKPGSTWDAIEQTTIETVRPAARAVKAA